MFNAKQVTPADVVVVTARRRRSKEMCIKTAINMQFR